jgi:hypothetical protein
MGTGNYKEGFKVPGLSGAKIRATAMQVRAILMANGNCPDLEKFVNGLDKYGISVDVVDEGFLPRGVEASCIPEQRTIFVTASTYADICRNDERARFTIFHELGHLLLAHSRSFHRDVNARFEIWENSEWQADQFAAEILMPLEIILRLNLTCAAQLQNEFGVSFHAASYRLMKLRSKREIKNA